MEGDGIGPELAKAARMTLDAVQDAAGVRFDVDLVQAGDAALADTGRALPQSTLNSIRNSDACLKAPVGESAADVIVALRRMLDLYANVRPARSYPGMPALRNDIDMVIVRENTEDLYTGKEFELDGAAVALRIISYEASARIAEYAFCTAEHRNGAKKVACVHKSNVMRVTDGVFARACRDAAARHPDIEFEEMYVDACAMNLIRQPEKFDVIVTTNMFGDILSDESSQAAGGLGAAPAANIGDNFAIFEPVHGAAFDIAGQNTANPMSFILSVRMMLDWLAQKRSDDSCRLAGAALERAVLGAVSGGVRTKDIGGAASCSGFADEVSRRLAKEA